MKKRKPWWLRPSGKTISDLRLKFSTAGERYRLQRDVGSRFASGVTLVQLFPEGAGDYLLYPIALRGNSKQRRQQYRAIVRHLRTVSATHPEQLP